MKDRASPPFAAHEVRKLLEAGEIEFRRAMKPQPPEPQRFPDHTDEIHRVRCQVYWGAVIAKCPYGQPGDRLWVRETHRQVSGPDWGEHQRGSPIEYRADGENPTGLSDIRWRSPLHMPRWASRIDLEIVAVRVERGKAWEWVTKAKRIGQ